MSHATFIAHVYEGDVGNILTAGDCWRMGSLKAANLRLVLDASAFVMGLDAAHLDSPSYTTPAVLKEVRGKSPQLRLTVAMEAGKLTVLAPSEDMLKPTIDASAHLGDRPKLSNADLSVIALALQLKTNGEEVRLVSDDYSVQNVARHLDIPYISLSTRGIRSKIRWVLRCRSCGKLLPSTTRHEACPDCGGIIYRKPAEKTQLRPRQG